MPKFDPYHKWLGIKPSEQPPHLYRLLGIGPFESDPEVIEAAADRQMAFLRTCATGPHLEASQQLLNAVAKARVILLNPQKKRAYDSKLQLELQNRDELQPPDGEASPRVAARQSNPPVVSNTETPSRPNRRNLLVAAGVLPVLLTIAAIAWWSGGRGDDDGNPPAVRSTAAAAGQQLAARGDSPAEGLSITPLEEPNPVPSHENDAPVATGKDSLPDEVVEPADVEPADAAPVAAALDRPAVITDLGVVDFEASIGSLQAKAAPLGLPDGAILFIRPPGDGRRGANGFRLAIPEFAANRATEWTFRYQRDGHARGIHVIHPFRQGHVLALVSEGDAHVWAGGGAPDSILAANASYPATRTEAYRATFPLDTGQPRQIASRLTRDGRYSLLIDGVAVLTAAFDAPEPLELPETYAGEGLTPQWPAGTAGLLIGPTDVGLNRAEEIRFLTFAPATAVVIPGLVAYYPLDETEGINVEDAGGQGFHGVVIGAPQWVAGKLGGAIKLVGETYVDLGDTANFDTSDAFSIAAWVQHPETGQMCILLRTSGEPAYRGYDLMTYEGRPLVHLIHDYRGSQIRLLGRNRINDGRWRHVAMTYDGTSKAAGINIYVDGERQELQVTNNSLNGAIKSDSPLTIGQDDPSDSMLFEGTIDELRIYNRELTLDEVLLLIHTETPTLIAAEPEAKSKVPDDAALETAMAVVKNLFKDEYRKVAEAKTPRAQAKLASKLLDQARQTKDDLASHYVLLRESANLAAEAADATIAVSAVAELGRQFQIDLPDEKHAVLVRVSRFARTADANQLLAGSALGVIDDATAADRFDLAMRLCTLASGAATKARNPALVKDISDLRKKVIQLRKDHDAAVRAAEVLEEHPDDAEANLTRGRYLFLRKGQWEAGLPLLVKASDSRLKSLAEKEMAAPTEPDAQRGLADEWWKEAEQAAGLYKDDSRERAVYWYQLALPKLSTLQQAAIAKRLREHQATVKPQWTFAGVASYIQELNALNHPQCPDELSVEHQDGAVRIWGTCQQNTRRIAERNCGWFGKVVMWSVRRPSMIEARLRLEYKGTNWNDEVLLFDESGRALAQLEMPSTALQNRFIVTFEFDSVTSNVRLAVRDQERVVVTKEISVDPRKPLHVGIASVVRRPGDVYDLRVGVAGKE